jgi:hypothetical protein
MQDPDLDRLLKEIDGGGASGRRATPQGPKDRVHLALRSNFFRLALGLALAEVVVLLWKHQNWLLGAMAAGLALALAIMLWVRLRAGLVRDLVGVFAIAQAFVVAIPLAVSFSFALGLLVALAVIAGLVGMIFFGRRL